MVTGADTIHPTLSVTVTVYVPAASPVAVIPIPPEGDQLCVYGAVPPAMVTEAEPLVPPKHETFDTTFVVAVGDKLLFTATELVEVQPLLSVTVTVYDPARRVVAVEAVPPEGAHE